MDKSEWQAAACRQDRVKEQRFEWEWGLEKESVWVFTGQELTEPRGRRQAGRSSGVLGVGWGWTKARPECLAFKLVLS